MNYNYSYQDVIFVNRTQSKRQRLLIPWGVSGNRPLQGSDVVALARTQFRNFTDPCFVPDFAFTDYPPEWFEKEKTMSSALWCDAGDHAFSARDKGRKAMAITEFDDDGNAHSEQGDICSAHAAGMAVFKNRPQSALPDNKVNEAKEKGYDPEYVKWLEKQNGINSGDGE